MRTVDRLLMRAPLERVFRAAADVERWPELLPHYRWVRMRERRSQGQVVSRSGGQDVTEPLTLAGGVVEMAAWRPFGPLKYPTWWVSEMWIEPDAAGGPGVRYRHIEGITAGMDVRWELRSVELRGEGGRGTEVTIVHEWDGPRWPLIRRPAAEWVIGPVFIHGIASRTLAGIRRAVERAREVAND